MASQKSKRRSRKGRSASRPAPAPAAAPPPVEPATPRAKAASKAAANASQSSGAKVTPKVAPKVQSTRRQQREERERQMIVQSAQAGRQLGKVGPEPRSIFHPIPVSEIAILAGMIGVIIGVIDRGNPSLWVGAIVCGLGVFEFTAREHFSGYRSHTTLLAAFPTVVVEVIFALFFGVPKTHVLLLVPVIPVFALSFWLLHRAFRGARHARVVKSPAP